MSFLKIAIGVAALVASFSPASLAAAETVVPPGNGAATQYTEAIPGPGGNAVPGNGIKGGGGSGHSSPSHVLGHHNAEKLEGEGQVGREVAKVAAETAPTGTAAPPPAASSGKGKGEENSTGGGAPAGGNGGNGGGGSGSTVTRNAVSAETGSGSSGLGEVLGQATGSSSGEAGLLLPLILLAAVMGSIAYAWRRRRLAH